MWPIWKPEGDPVDGRSFFCGPVHVDMTGGEPAVRPAMWKEWPPRVPFLWEPVGFAPRADGWVWVVVDEFARFFKRSPADALLGASDRGTIRFALHDVRARSGMPVLSSGRWTLVGNMLIDPDWEVRRFPAGVVEAEYHPRFALRGDGSVVLSSGMAFSPESGEKSLIASRAFDPDPAIALAGRRFREFREYMLGLEGETIWWAFDGMEDEGDPKVRTLIVRQEGRSAHIVFEAGPFGRQVDEVFPMADGAWAVIRYPGEVYPVLHYHLPGSDSVGERRMPAGTRVHWASYAPGVGLVMLKSSRIRGDDGKRRFRFELEIIPAGGGKRFAVEVLRNSIGIPPRRWLNVLDDSWNLVSVIETQDLTAEAPQGVLHTGLVARKAGVPPGRSWHDVPSVHLSGRRFGLSVFGLRDHSLAVTWKVRQGEIVPEHEARLGHLIGIEPDVIHDMELVSVTVWTPEGAHRLFASENGIEVS